MSDPEQNASTGLKAKAGLPAREVATLLAKAIFEVEANLEEAKWFAGNKQWILASVHINRALHLLKSAQKIHEQAHGVAENTDMSEPQFQGQPQSSVGCRPSPFPSGWRVGARECPACGGPLSYNDWEWGREWTCPHCEYEDQESA